MKALVLAAGYATRLHPYTRNFPKALLKVGGRPLLDALLERIAAVGEVDAVTVVTNHRFAPFFERWLRERGRGGPEVRILNDGTTRNEDRLGSIGDLALAVEREGIRDDLLLTSSDKLFDFRLEEMVAAFRRRGAAVNACFDAGDPRRIRGRHGCAVLDADGRIVDFQEKPDEPRSSIQSVTITILPAGSLGRVREYLSGPGRNPDAPGFFLEWLHRREPLYAWTFEGACLDVGSLEAFWRANRGEVERDRLLLALVVDRVPGGDPGALREELLRTLRRLDREEGLYLATLLTAEERVPLYEEVLLGNPTRVPLAVRGGSVRPELERTGLLSDVEADRPHVVAWVRARPDWLEEAAAPPRS